MASEPIVKWKTFVSAHQQFDEKVKRYALGKRGREGEFALDEAMRENLADRSSLSLKATNCRARIEFCRAARNVMKATTKPMPERPAYFLTLSPIDFVTTAAEAETYDWSVLQVWADKVLKGFCYFGIVDAAPYANTPTGREKVVSWHIHAIVWGASRDEMEAFKDSVNERYGSLLPNREAAHVRVRSSWKGLRQSLIYMLKAPLKTYRVYAIKSSDKRPTGEYQQKKDWHRSGEAAAVCRFMHGAEIDKLCVAGLGGREVLERTTARSISTIVRQDVDRLHALIRAVA
ncbi:hypothetical protein EN962_00255 [Mesorhizobium sp. M7A.F.Ca.CA.001.09.2.1]|uniref:Replication protein n=1 Tax=Mesorhizobium ciceri TaxID=39645 RepID=A0AB38TBC3_9HYPH|nr:MULTISPECIES: hypothetical protein [Mesorhizobium]RUY29549.1 hypothetical protein EN981_31980 [Mesorhizobium sp. M7A.F.Ca.CA.001.13.2.1]MDF3214808.1 hypothetical protein [Mesorhizobium ciceri]RUX78244.1 hypothetical protein EN990_02505 [Mesorhizobium sp. M7A.F.Ca.US.005.03.1.1]RUY18930.1 hypothetical protein EN991_02320 [Mesorhizobium sp. M7A.F.Ca.US.005.03.2.1]RUY32181.1 hypothetical protein EN979_00255 [Mesorhizobium sp. M7A.F.Ca.US.001.04.2.1]